MEARERTAGNRDEQNGEHHAGGGGEAREHGRGDRGLALGTQHHDAQHGAHDHDDHHDGGQVVARLLEHLDGHGTRKHQVHHHDGDPTVEVEVHRELHAHREHGNHEDDAGDELLGTREVELAARPAKDHGNEGEQDRDRARAAGGIRLGNINGTGSIRRHRKGAGHHGGEGGDHDQAEQPAKEQEQTAARTPDVLIDELGERLAVVLHRGVQRAKIMHGAKEDAAHEDPQHHGQPAERHGDDGARHGTRTADRAELVRERRECRGGREVMPVLHAASGRERLAVNAPFVGQPSAIPQVTCGEHNRRDHHQHNSVHVFLPLVRRQATKNGPSSDTTAHQTHQPPGKTHGRHVMPTRAS